MGEGVSEWVRWRWGWRCHGGGDEWVSEGVSECRQVRRCFVRKARKGKGFLFSMRT